MRDSLVESDWKTRQSAANIVRLTLKVLKQKTVLGGLEYHILSENAENGELKIIQTKQVSLDDILKSLIPINLMVLMKDHFNDFEELKVLTPVREVTTLLFVHIIET